MTSKRDDKKEKREKTKVKGSNWMRERLLIDRFDDGGQSERHRLGGIVKISMKMQKQKTNAKEKERKRWKEGKGAGCLHSRDGGFVRRERGRE